MRMENEKCSFHCSGLMLTIQLSYLVKDTETSMLLNRKGCIESLGLSLDQGQANFLCKGSFGHSWATDSAIVACRQPPTIQSGRGKPWSSKSLLTKLGLGGSLSLWSYFVDSFIFVVFCFLLIFIGL